jgi:hypothetical protein
MKKIDVYLDLEGIGRLEGGGELIDNVEILAERLPAALAASGFQLGSVIGFASYYSGFACGENAGRMVPFIIQSKWKKAFREKGWTMVWSDVIADEALASSMRKSMLAGTLAEAVMLVTCDSDFIPLMRDVRESGRYVIVSGQSMSKRLPEYADRAVHLLELLGTAEYKKLIKDRVATRSELCNSLSFPFDFNAAT